MRSHFRLPAPVSDELTTQLIARVDATVGQMTLVGGLDRQTAHRLLDAAATLAAVGRSHWVIDARPALLRSQRVEGHQHDLPKRAAARRHDEGGGGWPVPRRALASIRLHHHAFGEDGRPSHDGTAIGDVPAAFPLVKVYAL